MLCAFYLGVDLWGEGEIQFFLGGCPLSWGSPLPSHPNDHVALESCHSGGASTLRKPSEHQRPRLRGSCRAQPAGAAMEAAEGCSGGPLRRRRRGHQAGAEAWRSPAHTSHPGAGNRPTHTHSRVTHRGQGTELQRLPGSPSTGRAQKGRAPCPPRPLSWRRTALSWTLPVRSLKPGAFPQKDQLPAEPRRKITSDFFFFCKSDLEGGETGGTLTACTAE